MQSVLDVPARAVSRQHVLTSDSPSFAQVWRDTWRVFVTHPTTLLGAALFGFGLTSVVGALIYGALIVDGVLRFGTHTGRIVSAFQMQMLAQGAIGLLTASLGQGMIAWIALEADRPGRVTWRSALHAAIQRLPALLIATLLAGTIFLLGNLALISLLRELRLDISSFRWLRAEVGSGVMWTITRALAALFPDPGSPISEWLSFYRFSLARTSASSTFYAPINLEFFVQQVSAWRWIVGAGGLFTLMLGDALFSMRYAAVMNRPSTWGALRESVLVGSTYAWRVIRWRWTVRLLSAGMLTLLFFLPVGLHQVVVVSAMRNFLQTGFWVWHVAQSLYVITGALLSALVVAFGAVFESRMWVRLCREAAALRED